VSELDFFLRVIAVICGVFCGFYLAPMTLICWHKWSKWSEPEVVEHKQTHEKLGSVVVPLDKPFIYHTQVQAKACLKCGLVKERVL